MRIRTLSLLAIVPIFLGLAGAGSALIYRSADTELRWGLGLQAESLAVASAAFIRGAWMESADSPDFLPTIEARLDTVARENGVLLAALVAPDGTPFAVAGSSPGASLPAVDPASLANGVFVTPLVVTEGSEEIAAVALLADADGAPAAYLHLVVDATRYGETMRRVEGLIVGMLAVAGSVGFILALVVAGRIGGPLRRLAHHAGHVADGGRPDGDAAVSGQDIAEIGELRDSLHTVRTVVESELERARRILLENEQYRTTRDLVETLGAELFTTGTFRAAGVEASLQVTAGTGAEFCGGFDLGEQALVLLGRLASGTGIDLPVESRAILLFARHLATSRPLHDLPAGLAAAFPDVELVTAAWERGGQTVTTTRVAGGILQRTSLPLDRSRAAAVHALNANGAEVLARYLAHHPGLPAHELGRDLGIVLGNRSEGAFAILTPDTADDGAGADGAELAA